MKFNTPSDYIVRIFTLIRRMVHEILLFTCFKLKTLAHLVGNTLPKYLEFWQYLSTTQEKYSKNTNLVLQKLYLRNSALQKSTWQGNAACTEKQHENTNTMLTNT